MSRFTIDGDACIGCGVSSSMAPTLIHLGRHGRAELARQPDSRDEVSMIEAAALLCPVGAIRQEPST